MANPLDTLLQKVRSNVGNTASRLFGGASLQIAPNSFIAQTATKFLPSMAQSFYNSAGPGNLVNAANKGINYLTQRSSPQVMSTQIDRNLDLSQKLRSQGNIQGSDFLLRKTYPQTAQMGQQVQQLSSLGNQARTQASLGVGKTALTLSGAKFVNPVSLGIGGLFGAGMSKLTGGNPYESAGQAIGQTPSVLGLSRFTGPIGSALTSKFGSVAQQTLGRTFTGAVNLAENEVLSRLDEKVPGISDRLMSFGLGAIMSGKANEQAVNKFLSTYEAKVPPEVKKQINDLVKTVAINFKTKVSVWDPVKGINVKVPMWQYKLFGDNAYKLNAKMSVPDGEVKDVTKGRLMNSEIQNRVQQNIDNGMSIEEAVRKAQSETIAPTKPTSQKGKFASAEEYARDEGVRSKAGIVSEKQRKDFFGSEGVPNGYNPRSFYENRMRKAGFSEDQINKVLGRAKEKTGTGAGAGFDSEDVANAMTDHNLSIRDQLRAEYNQSTPPTNVTKGRLYDVYKGKEFSFVRNPEKAPSAGNRFGQNIEPSGKYMNLMEEGQTTTPPGWETGKVKFNNPLVIDWGEGYQSGKNWKNVLSEKYGGKTGKSLSEAIKKDGYDGIITLDGGKPSEVVSLVKPSSGGEIGGVTKGVQTPPSGKARGFTTSVQEAPKVQKKVKGLVDSTYIPKRNAQLMGEAQALLQEGASIDLKNTQNIDKKITATMQEALSQQRKNPQLAANLYNNLAEKGTELGRGVQAFSLLNKMSPDAIALSAAGKIKAYNRTAVRKIPELNGEQVKMISKQVDAIKKLAEGSRERNIAVNNLSNIINDFIPSSFADKVIATWKAGLLTSLRTSERNIFGNTVHGMVEAVKDLPASLADRLMAGVTGKRTLTPTFQGAGEMYSKRTGQQMSDVLRLGYDASEDISKFDHKRITWTNTPVQQALKKYTDIVFRSLGAQDKPFYNSAFKRSLYSQAGAEAINIGQEGNRKVIQKLVENPTDEMIKTAISDANVATFKDKNSASAIASAIKREMAKVNIGGVEIGKIASEVMMPFTGVPTSILGQIANYSPIGLLKGIINTGKVMAQNVPELQRQAAHEIGRGVIGTGVFGLGAYLASKGLITGQPKDAGEQRQWDLENKPRNSIMINGKWRSLNSVGPEAVVFLAGAKLNEEMNNPEGSIGGYAGTLGKDYLDQSFVTGLQQPVNVLTDPARYGKSYAGNMIASTMPNIVKDVAKSQDDTQREANTVTDYAKLATPFVRNTLIEKRDTLGNVMKQEPTGLGAFFDLFNSKTPVDNAVVNELSRLQKEGQGATPSKLTPNQTIQKQKIKLTFEQLNQLEKGVGEALQPRLQALVTSPNYLQLDDEQKAQAIDKVVQTTRTQYKNINAGAINTGSTETKLPQGEMIPIVNKNGNVTMVDTSFQPEKPKLTGQAELDKKLLSSYYSDITKKSNDIVDLFEAGKLTAQEANTQLTALKSLKGSGKKTPKVSMSRIKMPKLKKLKAYKPKKIKFKKIKLPKIKPLKAQRV